MSYKLNWEEKGIWLWHGDTVNSKEIFDSNREFYSDPRSDDCSYQIIDFLDVENIVLTEFTPQKIAFLDSVQSQSTPHIKVALVGTLVSAKQFFRDYIDNSNVTKTSWSFKMFNDLKSARKWASH
ncbi:MAG: hypothetical protein OQL19_10035 [Gammaproteobacteria bacterium]|nr:hypothetical protein [Gammaproteobacteria bacterium]